MKAKADYFGLATFSLVVVSVIASHFSIGLHLAFYAVGILSFAGYCILDYREWREVERRWDNIISTSEAMIREQLEEIQRELEQNISQTRRRQSQKVNWQKEGF